MGLACWLAWVGVRPQFLEASFGVRLLMLAALCAGGAAIYVIGAKLLRVQELDAALGLLRRRRPT
jgi:hypothetical protein